MIVLLCIMIMILIGIIIYQHYKYKNRSIHMNYMTKKLEQIIEEKSFEQVKVVTSDQQINELNSTINDLLEYSHKNIAAYNRTKMSMKKMLSNVSHDLKTPLTVVLGYLEMLSMKYEKEEELQKVYRKVQEVIELINTFFDLAKLESGDKVIKMERVDLSEICRVSVINMSSLLEDENIEVDIQIPENEYYINGNETELNRVMNNLISNAIRYGMDGKYLGIRLYEKENSAVVEIIDHGKGIERQYQQEVFERLYTLEDSRSMRYQGNGLGLTITKTLVEAMGGTLNLTSIPYKKTIFSISFHLT